MSVRSGCPGYHLAQSDAITVVVEQRSDPAYRSTDQPVGLVIAIQCAAIVEQVAIVIPRVVHAANIAQAIGCVIGVVRDLCGRDRPRLNAIAMTLYPYCVTRF